MYGLNRPLIKGVRISTTRGTSYFTSGMWLPGRISGDHKLSSLSKEDIVRLMLKDGSWRLRSQYTLAKGIGFKIRALLVDTYDLYGPQKMWDMNHRREVLHPLTEGRLIHSIPLVAALMQDIPGYSLRLLVLSLLENSLIRLLPFLHFFFLIHQLDPSSLSPLTPCLRQKRISAPPLRVPQRFTTSSCKVG
jgi:hypothetical protein